MADRVLIFGASGFIGTYLHTALRLAGCQVTGTCHSRSAPGLVSLDLLDVSALRRCLSEARPDLVAFLSGTKDVERCEHDPAYACDLNVQVVRNYLDACQQTRLSPATLFFSTDYVFDGLRGRYRSGDAVGPRTVYGATNLLAERLLYASGLPGILLRVSAVMGRNGGFFKWLERSLAGDQPVLLFDNTYFSPTSIGRLCHFVNDYVASVPNTPAEDVMRIVHLSDGYRMSRYQFGCAVTARMGKPTRLLVPGQADFAASTFQADLSLMPDGLDEFHEPAGWNELENIF